MSDRRSNDLRRPLMQQSTEDLHTVEEGSYLPDSRTESVAGSEPTPSWLSERQDPLQDSPTSLSNLGMGGGRAAASRPMLKATRSMRRSAAAAAKARRPWIVIDEQGRRSFLHADKRAIIHSTGLNIPIRDMRLLDYNLGASDSTILVRDNAIIVSMEHVRCIVTSDRCIIPREGSEHNPLTARFVDVLEDSVVEWTRQRREFQEQQDEEVAALARAEFGSGNNSLHGGSSVTFSAPHNNTINSNVSDYDDTSSRYHEIQEPLPFELVVLEAALKEVVASQALQIKELEGVALPALDALTKTVSPANLERVRKVKTRHQRLTLRAEALRDELQRFLQDDDDMAEMCLTRRKEIEDNARYAVATADQHQQQHQQQQQQHQGGSGGGISDLERADTTPATPWSSGGGGGVSPAPSAFAPSSMTRRGGLALARFHSGSPPQGLRSSSTPSALPSRDAFLSMSGNQAAAVAAAEEDADADAQQEVENLLESYYMQVDGLFDKLVSVGEYIKDTEELVNIELDSARNRLIRFEVLLSVATFALLPFNLMAGVLGENLIIPDEIKASVEQFYGINLVATGVCGLIFYIIIVYMRFTKLL